MLPYLLNHFALYLLVLLRWVAFMGTSPLFSMRIWPAWSKLGLAAFGAALVVPQIHAQVPDPYLNPGAFVVMALQETVSGLFIGFLATLLFSAISVAGQAFDIQIGFSSATLFDPQMGASTGLTGSFLSMLFTLYFLGIDGLDGLVLSLLHSFQFIPVGTFHFPALTWAFLGKTFGLVMTLGLQLAAPLIAALLLTDFTLALLSRAVPQMNVFVVGLPAKLFLGLSMFAAVMPGVIYVFGVLFRTVFQQLDTLLRWLGG